MRVLVIGSGGREHALCWAIAASPLLTKLWCAPGNPGIAAVAECVPIGVMDFPALVAFAPRQRRSISWFRGRKRRWSPASPMRWRRPGIACCGPTHGGGATGRQQDLHQGDRRRRRHSDREMGAFRRRRRRARIRPPPRRADRGQGRRPRRRQGRGRGRDRGRGAEPRSTRSWKRRALRRSRRRGGDRGMPDRRGSLAVRTVRRRARRCCSARRRTTSASATATPGRTPAAWAPIRRCRRFRRAASTTAIDRIIRPALAEMARRGTPFRGVLYAGLMLTDDGPKLIEFNVRFGDPECQVLLLRLRSDLLPALQAACDGELANFDLRWFDDAADRGGDGGARLSRGAGTRHARSAAWTQRPRCPTCRSSTPAPKHDGRPAACRRAAGC